MTGPEAPVAERNQAPAVALIDWAHVLEDYLGPLGVSLDAFLEQMMGGWIFGYLSSLRVAGLRPLLICVSKCVERPTRRTHLPSGTSVWLLPAPTAYRRIRRYVPNPYADTIETAVGLVGVPRRVALRALKELAPYLATPPLEIARVLRAERAAALICQEYENPRFDICTLSQRALGVPVFATFQGGDAQRGRLERPIRPLTIGACAGLIVATSSEARRVRRRYGVPREKIASIYNPLDVQDWSAFPRAEARAALGLPSDVRICIWHGRVEVQRKGLDVLLDAWRRLCTARPRRDLRLLLVGTGAGADKLRRRLAAQGASNVTWIDRFVHDRAELRRYLSAADLYAFASRHEGFPVAPLEAMACGLPLVAADAEGVSDILGDGEEFGGIIVPRGRPQPLAEAMGRVIDDAPFGRELGIRARQRIERRFSIQEVGAQLRAFLASRGAPFIPGPGVVCPGGDKVGD